MPWFIPFAGLLTLVPASAASAASVYVLQSGDAEIGLVVPTTPSEVTSLNGGGITDWTIADQNYLQEQSWWYRVGGAGGTELPISQLGTPVVTVSGDNGLTLTYGGSNAGVQISVQYTLTGGIGTGTSGLSQNITVQNYGATSQSIDVLLYGDFNMDGVGNHDVGAGIFGRNRLFGLQQSSSEADMDSGNDSLTVSGPAVSSWEMVLSNALHASLDNGSPITLNNMPGNDSTIVGPGNLSWALDWTLNVPGGGTQSFAVAENLTNVYAVPLAPSLYLGLMGFLSLIAHRLLTRQLFRREPVSPADPDLL